MKNLYNEEQLIDLRNKINGLKFLFIFLIVIFAAIETLLIIFATYEHKAIFMILAILSTIILVVSVIYTIDKRKYLIVIYGEIASIMDLVPISKTIQIVKNSYKTITLSDSTCVYEIIYKENDKEYSIFLNNIFDNIFEVGKTYKILQSDRYIVGYDDEY